MNISDLLSADRIVCGLALGSKKRALEALSQLLSQATEVSLSDTQIVDGLLARERLGSTGLGHGVAIPHGRFKDVDQAVGAFVRLEEGVDFDAIDGDPVDLMFALIVPEESTEEHLQLLASLAEMFSDATIREGLRRCGSAQDIEKVVSHWRAGGNRVASSR
ncbi:PTS sugar transporter subunit IIA [Candidatus Tenderia electrophaga]|jgi:PTS system nitrogen regulatory IIA component|uniref:PTS sugar transporter subunit IIA n=1 Tax=Candidatus Tenderia electrophaga TaxID=1748243 RepID=A0A0S2T942_9GAMM|nr:PTS sugar transporter subunit IIA [Candidatus Tenderia electrophaga]